ncbi:MAG: DUF3810 domain-containing protein, partial [Butyrivibrio sp.]|nr:DUF3810 domain-containing protein [Butyrivibrio sp.]
MKIIKRIVPVWLVCAAFIAVCTISEKFSDFYIDKIFPIVTYPLMYFSSLFNFSVGEWMIVIGLLWLAILFITVILHIVKKVRYAVLYYKITAWILTVICVVMCLNCFSLYHHSKIYETEDTEYNFEELVILRNYVVEKCNEFSLEVERDENGEVLYEGNMEETAKSAVKALSAENPRLSGFYTTPKTLYFSWFMSQQYLQGYYFPFSMEANINGIMKIMNKPFTMCHELSHTKGFIYEDEANFIGFLACINSEDIVFQYSGYLGVLNYINNDLYKAVGKEEYKNYPAISSQVKTDNEFLSEDTWKDVEDNSVLNTET